MFSGVFWVLSDLFGERSFLRMGIGYVDSFGFLRGLVFYLFFCISLVFNLALFFVLGLGWVFFFLFGVSGLGMGVWIFRLVLFCGWEGWFWLVFLWIFGILIGSIYLEDSIYGFVFLFVFYMLFYFFGFSVFCFVWLFFVLNF